MNCFFASLDKADAKKIRSAKFSEIRKKRVLTDIFGEYFEKNESEINHVSTSLQLLEALRNDETHFSIDQWQFLTEREYEKLYNFMVIFIKILKRYKLLPWCFGKASRENQRLDFSKQPISKFSYKSALRSAPLFLDIKNHCEQADTLTVSDNSAYGVAREIFTDYRSAHPTVHFDDVWAYAETAIHYGIIMLKEVSEVYDSPDCGECYNCYYEIHFNNL